MYRIEYCTKENNKKGIYSNIDKLIIDTRDILMMKYVDIIHDGDKILVSLYLKYLKYIRKNKDLISEIAIINNSDENEKIIASIISCKWLINSDSISFNKDTYDKIKDLYQEQINVLKDSKKNNDINSILLMEYFIASLPKAFEKDNSSIKEKIKVLK